MSSEHTITYFKLLTLGKRTQIHVLHLCNLPLYFLVFYSPELLNMQEEIFFSLTDKLEIIMKRRIHEVQLVNLFRWKKNYYTR